MLLSDLRRAFQGCEQFGEPYVVFGVIGEGVDDKPFIGDLLQPELANTRQSMRGMHGNTDCVTVKFLERKPVQDFRGQLNQQSKVQLAITQSAQHFLSGHVVKLNAHTGIRFLKESQRTRSTSTVSDGA